MADRRKVCVSGLGMITPLGTGHEVYWKKLLAGETGIEPVEVFKFPVPDEPSLKVSAPLKFEPVSEVDAELSPDIYWANRLLIHSAHMAVRDAGMERLPEETAVALGAGASSTISIEKYEEHLVESVRAGRDLQRIPEDFSGSEKVLAAYFRLKGDRMMVATACSSSALALGHGYDRVAYGESEFAVVGCADTLCQLTHSGFYGLRSIDPERCRPFDKDRKGISIGEASVVLLLESEASVLARGHKPYCTISGWWANCDAIAMTSPDATGQTLVKLIKDVMADAGVSACDVDYVCAHGTGTVLNDQVESMALNEVFAGCGKMPHVSSIKGAVGHCMAGAAIMNAATVALAIRHGRVPPNTGLREKDQECVLDPVMESKACDCRVALSNAFAFGGNNTSIVFRKWEG